MYLFCSGQKPTSQSSFLGLLDFAAYLRTTTTSRICYYRQSYSAHDVQIVALGPSSTQSMSPIRTVQYKQATHPAISFAAPAEQPGLQGNETSGAKRTIGKREKNVTFHVASGDECLTDMRTPRSTDVHDCSVPFVRWRYYRA